MKKLKFCNHTLASLPLVTLLIAFRYFPTDVPIHFAINGTVNRVGQKYSLLVIPIGAIILHCFWTFIAKTIKRQGESTQSIKAIYLLDMTFSIIMYCVTINTVVKIVNYLELNSHIDWIQIVATVLSYILIVVGYGLQHSKRNALFGIRTKYSLANESNWKDIQKLGSLSLMIGGGISVLWCIALNGINSIIVFSVLSLISAIIPTIISVYKGKSL